MPHESDLVALIEHIYEAAADPACWQTALDAFCAHYPGGRGTILHHDVRLGSGSFPIVSANWDRKWVQAYNDHYASINPWLKNLKKRPVGLAVPAEFMLDRASLLKTQFYCDYMKPQDLSSAVGVTIHQDHDRFTAVSVIFPERTAEKERENVALLQRVAAHFRRAMQVNNRLAKARLDGATAEATLDRLPVGCAITDAAGIIIHCNRAAERIFAANDGLHIERTGAIATANPGKSSELHKAIRDAMTVLDDVTRPLGRTITVERKSGRQSYSVLAAPLRPRTGSFGAQRALALVMISDPDRGHRLQPAELASTFDITVSQARILSLLVDGSSVAEASSALGISMATARTHIKNIFAKVGHQRQTDLVRMVTNHPIWFIDRD